MMDQQQSFSIRESNNSSNEFKLGKSLFILLNDNNDINNNNKIKLINQPPQEESLLNNQSDFKKSFDSLDKSISLNPTDSILSIIDSVILKYNEIQLKHDWKFNISAIISNLINNNNNNNNNDIILINNNNKSSPSSPSSPIPTPPQHYFKIYRLFSYILNNHNHLFYKGLLLKIQQQQNEKGTTPLDKDQKKQILDLLNTVFQFMLIFNLNKVNNNNNNHKQIFDNNETVLLLIDELVPTIIDKLINKCSITTTENGTTTVSPTRLTTQSSDIVLSLFSFIIIQLINNDNDKGLFLNFKSKLLNYFKEIRNWYIHSKPLLSFSIDIIIELISSLQIDNTFQLNKIIPLLFQQIPISTKNTILDETIQFILKQQQQENEIQISTISFITVFSSLSEKNQNSFLDENKSNLSNLLQTLMNYDNGIIKKCFFKFIAIIYNIKIDDGNNDYLSLLYIEDLSEKPVLVGFIISSLCKFPKLVLSIIDLLKNQCNNEKIVDNIIMVLDQIYKSNDKSVLSNLENSLLDILLPSPSPSTTIRYQTFLFLVENVDPFIVFSRFIKYIFSETVTISTIALDFLVKWISTSCYHSSYSFEIFIELILGGFSTLPSNSNIINNSSDVNNNVQQSQQPQQYNYDKLIEECIPKIANNIKQSNENETFKKYETILSILEIKLFANPKNTTISKILPKLIGYIDKSQIFTTIITSVNNRLQSQNQLLPLLELPSTTTSISLNGGEEVFKILSPLLVLKNSIKELSSNDLKSIIEKNKSGENDIIMGQLSNNLIKRLNSKNIMLEIKRMASDNLGHILPSYWSNSLSISLLNQYNNNNNNESQDLIKLILFCFCNGYQIHGVVGNQNTTGIPFESSKRLFSLFDSILFKYNDSSFEKICLKSDSIVKLSMATGDCLSYIIKSIIVSLKPNNNSNKENEDENTISTKLYKSNVSTTTTRNLQALTMKSLNEKPAMLLLCKLDSLNDLPSTIFRIILTTKTNQSYNNETNNYSYRSKIILLNSLTTVVRLLQDDKESLEIYSNLVIGLLIKIYFIETNLNIVDTRIKCSTISVLFNLILRLDYNDDTIGSGVGNGNSTNVLILNSDDLYDICSSCLKSTIGNNIKLVGLQLLGALMKTPKILFSSNSNLSEIQYLLTVLSKSSGETVENIEIIQLSNNLLNILK